MSGKPDMAGLSLALSNEASMDAWLEITPTADVIASIEKLVEVKKGDVTLRDHYAAAVQEDDRLVKCIRAMDDTALEIFALYPDIEREEHITEIEFTNWGALPSEVAKVVRRLELEAHAIARVRFMQADAMLKARAAT